MARTPIRYEDFGKLEIDDENRLYWDGAPVVTQTPFSLPWWGQAALIITAASTFGMFVFLFLDFLGLGG